MSEAYGLSRTRDGRGRIVRRSINPYANCINCSAGGGTMGVFIIEVYDEKRQDNDNANEEDDVP